MASEGAGAVENEELTSVRIRSYSSNHLVFGKTVQIRHYPVTVSIEN
jgi:hypothetical protein